MMKLIFKNMLFLVLVLGISTLDSYASNPPSDLTEFTKSIKKDFNMNRDGEVTLTNKYGDISLKTWSKDQVTIDVTITVNARSESSADNVFDRIKIGFSNSSSYVKAETSIESSSKSSWWGNGEKGDFRIDYVVNMPDAASLKLNNKYGNSSIGAIGGDATVTVKYGDFDLESVGAKTNVILGYGNGTIGKINGLGVDVKYSKLKLKEASQVNIESKYSKIYIDKATKMKSLSKYDNYNLGELTEINNQGKYDHFEIESVDKISAYSKYTHFEIDELSKSAEFELKYGGVKVDDLKRGFEKILFDCEYTECKVYMDENVDFSLDAVVDYASIRYPQGMEIKYEKQKNSNHEVQGYRGSANSGKIKARLRYGGLKVK